MDLRYLIPGTTEPDIIVHRSALGSVSLRVAGVPVKGSKGRYPS